jgi:hypothetical protein
MQLNSGLSVTEETFSSAWEILLYRNKFVRAVGLCGLQGQHCKEGILEVCLLQFRAHLFAFLLCFNFERHSVTEV